MNDSVIKTLKNKLELIKGDIKQSEEYLNSDKEALEIYKKNIEIREQTIARYTKEKEEIEQFLNKFKED